jgi:hypothetical protein
VRHATPGIFMTSSASKFLVHGLIYACILKLAERHTVCFAAAEAIPGGLPTAYCIGWKLNGLLGFSEPLREIESFSLPFILGP